MGRSIDDDVLLHFRFEVLTLGFEARVSSWTRFELRFNPDQHLSGLRLCQNLAHKPRQTTIAEKLGLKLVLETRLICFQTDF